MKHPDVIAAYAREYVEERRRLAAHVTKNRARIERRLADAENAVQRAIRQIIMGTIAENEAARVLAPLRADIAKIKAQLATAPLPEKPVTLHPAALRRYEQQLGQLQRALADGIAAGELDAHASIRDLVERVIVSRDPAKPGGVQVDIRGRLAMLLGISVYPDAVRSGSIRSVGLMVPRGGIEPPTPAFSVQCSTN